MAVWRAIGFILMTATIDPDTCGKFLVSSVSFAS